MPGLKMCKNKKIKITEGEATLDRYYQHFVIAVQEKDTNEKTISELKEEITECEGEENDADDTDSVELKKYRILKQNNKSS